MSNDEYQKANLYEARLEKERSIPEREIEARMRWDMPILSENMKCSISLDLPIINCKPTKACSEVCYACQGRQFYRNAVVKSLALNRMISEDPERAARKVVDEAAGRIIRIAGSGELLPSHKPFIENLKKYGGKWWGFTRRVDTHCFYPELMFSIDSTTPASVLHYVDDEVPVSRRAYLRRPGDPPAPLEVAVTFPVHGPTTRYVEKISQESTDCPHIRKSASGCWDCKRCY